MPTITSSHLVSMTGQVVAVGQTMIVNDYAALRAALNNAPSGTVIKLAGGNYGDVNLQPAFQFNFTGNVTLEAADPNNPPVFDTLVLNNVSNITLSGITVHQQADASSVRSDPVIRIQNSDGIILDNMDISGDLAVNGINPSQQSLDATGNVLGLPTGRGITINNSTDITVQNSTLHNLFDGIRAGGVDGLNILSNDINNLRTTPIGGSDVDNVIIDGNHTHSSNPWSLGGAGDHGDFVHFWTDNRYQSDANDNITITNNFFDQGTGQAILGIYLQDKYGLGYEGVVIKDNVIWNADAQGMRLENLNNAQIINNTLLDSDPNDLGGPGINILHGSTNTVIDKNVLAFINVYADSVNGVTQGNNLFVQYDYPNKANYYDTLFADAMQSSPDLSDLMAAPGSVIAQGGYGSSLVQLDTTPSQPLGFITDVAGSGLALSVHQLDISQMYGPSGKISTNNASVSWDFGDGSVGSGVTVNHSYAQPGRYEVTANVQLGNGQTIVVEKTIEVITPVALAMDFEGGAVDQSGLVNGASIHGGVSFVIDGGDKAAKLSSDGYIKYSRSTDLFDNDSYTLLTDFRKDNLSDSGKLIIFPGSLAVIVNSGSILASVSTNQGSQWLKSNVSINDTAWHQLAVTFSGKTGEAHLYVDGQLITSISGLTGATQVGNVNHDFYVGNYAGGSFTGLVDNVAFLKGDLSTSDIQSLHAGTETISSLVGAYSNNPNFSLSGPSSGIVASVTPATQTPTPTPNPDSVVVPAPTPTTGSVDNGAGGSPTVSNSVNSGSFDQASYSKVITGTNSNNTLKGTSENDWIDAGNGMDKINGGAGDDYIIAGSGSDYSVIGGSGQDIFAFGTGDNIVKIVDFKSGEDKIHLTGNLTFSELTKSVSTYAGVTSVTFKTSSGDSLILRDVNPSSITQNDFVTDTSAGSSSTPTPSTSPSTVSQNQDNVVVLDTTNGSTGGSVVSVGSSNFDPASYVKTIVGTAGNNILKGTSENDWIDAGNGMDKINGGAGDDYIIAGSGSDYSVIGGSGQDIFAFGMGYNIVKIVDFKSGEDKIHLTNGLNYSELTKSSSVYAGVTTVTYKTKSGDSLIFRDVNPNEIDQNNFITSTTQASGFKSVATSSSTLVTYTAPTIVSTTATSDPEMDAMVSAVVSNSSSGLGTLTSSVIVGDVGDSSDLNGFLDADQLDF